MKKRRRFVVNGCVQGVGFRPAVFRHAESCAIAGFVSNTPLGVIIEAEGEEEALAEFSQRITGSPPSQAIISSCITEELLATGETGFSIRSSERSGDLLAGMPADIATCSQCMAELFDSSDRRFKYPFLNCTDCGPRFTIIRELPYDRERTSMHSFGMCPACQREYADPRDRRFDAQPNACAVCGPGLTLLNSSGDKIQTDDPVVETKRLLEQGVIVAIKGLGGYHLCCSAHNSSALNTLRQRKNRPHKAFAVMFSSLEQIRDYCRVSSIEEKELVSPARPIVVLALLAFSKLPVLVSPDTHDVGAFLPYTPLHHLLLEKSLPLVMTSCNRSEEPIVATEEALVPFLGTIADYALIHNRPIVRRCDDSVVAYSGEKRVVLRRSRGFVPYPIVLLKEGPPILACGADQKNTFCMTRGDKAYLSQYIGDMVEYTSHLFYGESVNDLMKLLGIDPAIVACDMHPDYHSTRYAHALGKRSVVPVQHHHAHIASCMAENRIQGPVIGIAFDGTGFGTDGSIWGGEFLVVDLKGFRRVGRLKQYPMPGGEEAVMHPVRMALSVLKTEGLEVEKLSGRMSEKEMGLLFSLMEKGINSPLTSSAGRLFDAVSAFLGFCDTASYEGQAAVRLQANARGQTGEPFAYDLYSTGDLLELSLGPAIREIVAGETAASVCAVRFHETMAQAATAMCVQLREQEKIGHVVLSGGVFQNALLLERTISALLAKGFVVYFHSLVSPNDSGIALGQAVVALANSIY
ncbi:MAG: carbamoyltransferase HypF [Candidatus Raymondbacteria bacterium RifOxyA12_full_50_37]|nr:MAG: carbamoyltransferase HypF [Candidatus Raymondbacteria bacterium RifOxyA12_full_50_37]OGJ86429.1 MAG: carbamoyltransferase HypF [Candidatus Raymondbacteria bacterium RIFOXYA2_FULL_49_16]OGJ95599.1 MAG: carbamoyltransferase HypF [Candidatus Raymondbacteria bacterium RIFOXYC2_FULL_50_21]OGP40010.1 MAG: carbamoyltransferase HypF [Candidatus Raymondbacteria bacterium RIFOXYB2_FULL_49_35]